MILSTVLVVDDDSLFRMVLASVMREGGFHVVTAHDAAAARSLFRDGEAAIDAVLLDIKLPDGSGLDLVREFKTMQPDCVVVAMTAQPDSEGRRRALQDGAFHYAVKPFSLEGMISLLQSVVGPEISRKTPWPGSWT